MVDAEPPDVLGRIRDVASRAPALGLLMLFGSRARGDVHARSDWEFAYLATPSAEVSGLSSTPQDRTA